MFRLRSVAILLLAVLVVNFAHAQRRPGGGSMGTRVPVERATQLDILITYPDSQRADDVRYMVELLSAGGALYSRTFSGANGHASFSVSAGSYRVRITGANIEDTTSETFAIFGGEMLHSETIPVKVRENSETAGTPGGMVSTARLNVPGKARKQYEKGMEALKSLDYKKAEDHFDKAIEEYPNFDWAYNSLGVVRMHFGDKEGAYAAFAKATEIDPKNVHAQRNIARLLIAEEKWADAEAAAHRSLALQPQDGDGLTLLAMAELNLGKVDQALADARRVHTGSKHPFPFAHLIAARACEAKQLNDEAAAEYRTYLQEAPNDNDATIAKEGLARLQK